MPSANRNKHWPPRWTRKHGAIYYVVPADQKSQWDGRAWYPLGKTEAEAWATWYSRVISPTVSMHSFGDLCDRYGAEIVPTLAEKTQRDYRLALINLRKVFGEMRPQDILPRHIYQYLDHRPKISGNREKAVMSTVMAHGVRWGLLDVNVVREVRRSKELPRERYVSDEELDAFLGVCSPFLVGYVALKMLTGLRQGQMLALSRGDWNAERKELRAPAAKGGRTVIYQGEALADAIRELREASQGPATSVWLISTRSGGRYTSDGFRSIWQRYMRKYVEKTKAQPFREHDLRAKVASDTDAARATQLLGHRSSAITQKHYRRAPEQVTVLRKDR